MGFSINRSLLLGAILVLANAHQNDALMSSVISKLKGVFSTSNNTTGNNNESQNRSLSNFETITNNSNNFRHNDKNYYDDRGFNHRDAPNLNQSNKNDNHHREENNGNKYDHFDYIDSNNNHQHETRDGDTRIPFWNIAHMVNSIEQVDHMLG